MNNKEKSREELIKDVEFLKKRVGELEKFEAECALLKEILQEEKDRAEKYLDIAGVMMVVIDLSGKVAFINKKGCEILGYDKKDIIGKNWFDNFLPKNIKEEIKEIFKKLISGKALEAEYAEENIVLARGEEKTISWHNTVLKDKSGHITATLSSGEDISESKIYEEKLKKANEEWVRTFDSVSDGIFIMDKENIILRANKAFFELFKVNNDDIVGKKCYEVVHKLTNPWPNCPFDKTKMDKKSNIEEIDDPELGISLLVTISPILNDKGELIGAVHTFKDITERKRVEKELIKLSSFPELDPNPIVEIDSKGRVEYVNPAAKNLFPDIEKSGLKHPFLEWIFDSISAVSKEEKNIFRREVQINSSYFLEVIHIRREAESIRIYGLDITERKNIEDEVRKKMAILEKFQKFTVGRELRMRELKAKIAELEARFPA